jgi:hypothetical protein
MPSKKNINLSLCHANLKTVDIIVKFKYSKMHQHYTTVAKEAVFLMGGAEFESQIVFQSGGRRYAGWDRRIIPTRPGGLNAFVG